MIASPPSECPGRGRPRIHQASAREADLPSHGGRRDDSRGATLGWQHPVFPDDLPGEPIRRLEKAWGHLLETAGLPHVPLKTTHPSWRTHAADCDIPPEHVQLLMGHAGLKITDTVYLKRIAPSLSASAQKVGAYIWSLLNPLEAGQAQWKGDGDVQEAASVSERSSIA
jgi:integrase